MPYVVQDKLVAVGCYTLQLFIFLWGSHLPILLTEVTQRYKWLPVVLSGSWQVTVCHLYIFEHFI